MLSVTATDILAVADPAALKCPTSLSSCLTLTDNPTASAWAPDNSALYLASAQTIGRYDPSLNRLSDLYTLEDGFCIRCLVCKDRSSIICCAGDKVHVLKCRGSTAAIAQTFGSHKRDILSISLSNDSTLLASASLNSIHIHNLAMGSHTALRGMPSAEPISVCAFHPHTRTRLLVGAGRQLLIYDTTRASGPLKIIPMNEAASGDIVAIACSPFSKTLVAAMTSGGCVGLIDLDKERGLFRSLNLKVPLTAIAFSPEGAAIYLGTETGNLLVIDLRALDKPPKSIIVSESGNRIDTLSVQKKIKNSPEDPKPKITPVVATRASGSKLASSPGRSRGVRSGAPETPARKVPIALRTGTPRISPATRNVDFKKTSSLARDSVGSNSSPSTRGHKSGAPKITNPTPLPSTSPKTSPRISSVKTSSTLESIHRSSFSETRSTLNSTTEPGNTPALAQQETHSRASSSVSNDRNRVRSQRFSSTSLTPSESVPTLSSHSARTVSSTSSSSAAARRKRVSPTSPAPPVPPLPAEIAIKGRRTPLAELHNQSRTPSPDLPDFNPDPLTPIPSQKKKKGIAILGLGTPEVKAWIKAGADTGSRDRRTSGDGRQKRKGGTKSVGFKDNENESEDEGQVEKVRFSGDENEEQEREKSLSMQISPRRPVPTTSSQTHTHDSGQSWEASPLRPRHATHMPGTPGAGSAHELLRTIVKDVMYDFQRETKAEMMGLHLDLVRVGRGWKQELRVLMEEYMGDLNDLREENQRLREENERLRRGY